MMTEQQQEQAARYVLGDLSATEEHDFTAQVRGNPELREFLFSLQKTLDQVVLAGPLSTPPPALKDRVLGRLQAHAAPGHSFAGQPLPRPRQGLRFQPAGNTGWKELPVPGAFIKLLSLQADRGYAVLLGKLDPGVRYPAHANVGPEDFYILTGDLHVGDQVLHPGDFHHADAGSLHEENYSVEGCTLLSVLTTDDPLVQFAMT
jgi:anti-sigma factor ChrR (cupin superfamily)